MQKNEQLIDMADNVIKSEGAQCVAAAIEFCEQLAEIRLSNCNIGDAGAISLFQAIGDKSKTVQMIDLSHNPITEKSFDALDQMLTNNKLVQEVILSDIQVKSGFSWSKILNKHGRIIKK